MQVHAYLLAPKLAFPIANVLPRKASMISASIYKYYNKANAIPTRLRYAGTYAIVITRQYGREGLGGQGMDCEWLAGLVWEVWGWVVNG